MIVVLGFTLAFVLSLLLVPVSMRLAERYGIIDKPGGRKVHDKPIPRTGGIAIYLAFWGSTVLMMLLFNSPFPSKRMLLGFFLGTTLAFLVGLLDDKLDLNPWIKLGGQVLTGGVLWASGIRIGFISDYTSLLPFLKGSSGFIYLSPLSSFLTTVSWVVLIMNALNLIDGLDGLLAGLTVIISMSIGLILLIKGKLMLMFPVVVLLGATLGFLRYNFYPARIFLGDSGSLFLGSSLAAISIMVAVKTLTFTGLIPIALLFGIPLFDTTYAVLRRLASKRPIFSADKEHIHHRLLQLGFSQVQAVLIIYTLSLVLSVTAVLVMMKLSH